ncbi:MAG: nucleotide sugar dehydrogenase [Vicinamibacterales bacterium]
MKIAIFGLGYVGSVSAACLAAAGHDVVGVDVDRHKLDLVGQGRSPIREPGLDELLGRMVAEKRIRVTDDTAAAVGECALSLICVGTPSRRNGSLESGFLERVIEKIGQALATTSAYHVVAVRSTLLPGVLAGTLVPLLEKASGRRVGDTLGVCVNPEFLREGSAIRDFERPPFTVVGSSDAKAADALLAAYAHLDAPVHRVLPDEASMVKYASNNFHAIKVAFANEIGAVCRQLGIDGQRVMTVFCEDRELNISPRYLRPGFGFGGSCLPKDLRAMVYVAKEHDLATPLLGSILPSNDHHIQRVVDTVLEMGKKRVALLGLSFKVGSDDLRESPFVRLAEGLIGKGVPLHVYDPDVTIGNVFGRNKAYVEEHLPHVAQLIADDLQQTLDAVDVVIVGKKVAGVDALPGLLRSQHTVIDLVGLPALGDVLRPWASMGAVLPSATGLAPVGS